MLKLKKSHIMFLGFIYLFLPVMIFFAGWLRLVFSIPLCLLMLTALFFIFKGLKKDEKEIVEIPVSIFFIAAAVIFLWCILSGQGGFYYQSNDWHLRNAIFHDLINYPWPVIYPVTHAELVYYIAHWLPAALVGKLFGWQAGNVALLFWTFFGIFLTYLVLYALFKIDTKKKATFLLIVLILFSGLDFIGIMYMRIRYNIDFPWHLEWWASVNQYSSNMTQLMWVFNQTVAPWLLTALLLCQKKISNIGILTVLVMPFAPLPFFGFAVIAAAVAFKRVLELIGQARYNEIFKEIFTVQNLIGLLTVFPVYYIYYSTNAQAGNYTLIHYDLNTFLSYIVPFYLFEFFIYSLIIFKRYKKDYLFYIFNIMLFIIPFIRIGNSDDFCMRASIPVLFVLMVYIIRYVFEEIKQFKNISVGVCVILSLLTIGAITPMVEQSRALNTILTDAKIADVADNVLTLSYDRGTNYNFLCYTPENTFFYQYLARK